MSYGLPTTGISGWFYLALGAGAGLIAGGVRTIQRVSRSEAKKSPLALEDTDLKWRAQIVPMDNED